METYQAGVNLGGWISQMHEKSEVHYQSYILEKDIELIASWGMDHVRLPVDYFVFESDTTPGEYLEAGLAHIDHCLEWCQQHGLQVIIDLHHAPGFSFTNTLQPETMHLNTLFEADSMQKRFIAIWEFMAKRYVSIRDSLVFELMNEVVLPESTPWNDLAERTIAAVHAIDPDRMILVGGNRFNAVSELKNIRLSDDPRVFYTFHFYEPLLFTHQKAGWSRDCRLYDQEVDYPGNFPNLAAFLDKYPEYATAYAKLIEQTANRDLLLQYLQPAFDFIQKTGRPLYCGEYGVYDPAPYASSLRWHTDLIDILQEWKIGRAIWNYKDLGFGLVDRNMEVRKSELVQIVNRKWGG